MSCYYTKKESTLAFYQILNYMGWTMYGFSSDKSDIMTDYFDPASWDGIAINNGFILVVDNYSPGKIGGAEIHRSYSKEVSEGIAKAYEKIEKLQTLANNSAVHEGEKANALSSIEKHKEKIKKLSGTYIESFNKDALPEVIYQKNPGNSKWHIERNGEIIAKGTGIYQFSDIKVLRESQLSFEKFEDNYCISSYYDEDEWPEQYEYYLKKKNEKIKTVNKFFNLVDKWKKITTIDLGDGEEEKLIRKTITKKDLYYIPEVSKEPTLYIKLGAKYRRYRGLENHNIYKIEGENVRKITSKWLTLNDGTSLTSYKLIPNKSTNSKRYLVSNEDYESGDVEYINLVEKVNTYEEVVWVKNTTTKKRNVKKKNVKKDITKVVEKADIPCSIETSIDELNPFDKLLADGNSKQRVHSITKKDFVIVVLGKRLEKKDFISMCMYLRKTKRGYYDKYSGGWYLFENNKDAA